MPEDTFTMADVEAINLETPEPAPAEEAKAADTEPKGEAGESAPEGLKSFAEAFNEALADDKVELPEEAEKEPEKAVEEPEQATDSKESRSSSDFKKIKEDRDNARRELEELKSKLEKLDDSDVNNIMEQLKTERDDLSQRLKLAAIERHPKFQQEFQSKVDGVIEQAKRIVGSENADRVAELMQMGESDYRNNSLDEMMMELSTTKQAQLGSLLTRIDEVRYERASALENAEQTYQQMMADQAKQHEAQLAETHKLFDNVVSEASNLEVFANRDGDDSWNAEVKERVDMARGIFSGENDPQELARASLWAAAGPKYRELLVQQIELNRRLQKQLGDQGEANPSVGSNGGPKKEAPKDFITAFNEAMGN